MSARKPSHIDGVIQPKKAPRRLNMKAGDSTTFFNDMPCESALTDGDAAYREQMATARDVMRRRCQVLRALAG